MNPLIQLSRIYDLLAPDYGDNYTLLLNITHVNEVLGIMVNLGRLLIAFAFLLSYFARPLWSAASTLWLRSIESQKPFFTLIFGGIGAIAAALEALYKQQ
jgi:hypothetical protein